jgi:hypothetical protein
MAWLLLIIGGCFEVGFTTCLRFVDGFRNLAWTGGFLLSVTLSMGLLEVPAGRSRWGPLMLSGARSERSSSACAGSRSRSPRSGSA